MESNSKNQDHIDDLEQNRVEDAEAEKVKGGSNTTGQPPLVRVPAPITGPIIRKADPCWIIPCV